jgi:hypothetical protein
MSSLGFQNWIYFMRGREILHFVYRQFTKFRSTIVWTYNKIILVVWLICLYLRNVGYFWLINWRKLVEVVEYLSWFESAYPRRTVWANTYPLICLLGYRLGEKIQDNFNTKLTLNLPMSTIVAPTSNDSKWQMECNSAFKGLNITEEGISKLFLFRNT